MIHDRVPIVNYPVRFATHEARAKDHVGLIVENGLDEERIFVGIVFQVGILNDDNVASGKLETFFEGTAFALIFGLEKDNKAGLGLILFNDVPTGVGTVIIDNDDFFF